MQNINSLEGEVRVSKGVARVTKKGVWLDPFPKKEKFHNAKTLIPSSRRGAFLPAEICKSEAEMIKYIPSYQFEKYECRRR